MLKEIEIISNKWFVHAPLLSEFLLRLTFEKNNSCPTIGIFFTEKNYIACMYNEKWLLSLSLEELEGVLLHEVMHILTWTSFRSKGKDLKIFNIASDMVINYEIENEYMIGYTKLKLPTNACRFINIPEYTGRHIVEEVYQYLINNPLLTNNIKLLDSHEGLENIPEEKKLILESIVEDVKNSAKAKKYGNMSNSLINMLSELFKFPTIPISKIIRKKLQNFVYGNTIKFYSWKKVNRRCIPLMGKYKKGIKLNLIVDTSGSCYDTDIQKIFFTEIEYISRKLKEIQIYEFDTKIKNKYKYKKGDWKTIKYTGGGGTDIQPIFDHLKKIKNKNYTIVFTDGEFNWKDLNLYNNKVLWAILKKDKLNLTEKGLFQ